MLRIINNYTVLPENRYFFNIITQNITNAFKVVDKGTDYFGIDEICIPYSNRHGLTFNIDTDKPGNIVFNTNQRRVYSLYAPVAGAYTVQIPLDLGFNEIKALREDGELSNVINVRTKEILGWIVGAVGDYIFDIVADILTLSNAGACSTASQEILERFFAFQIQAKKQTIETIDQFRNLVCDFLAATGLKEVVQALRDAGAGMLGVKSITLNTDYYWVDDNPTFGANINTQDGSTCVLARDPFSSIPLTDTLIKGNLAGGIYQYVILAYNQSSGSYTNFKAVTTDVRHWGSALSAQGITWEDIGASWYDVYKLDVDGFYHLMISTYDTKVFDIGDPLSSTNFLDSTNFTNLSSLPGFQTKLCFNTNVRSHRYQTDSMIIIYVEMFKANFPPNDYQKNVMLNIYNHIVSAHLPYEVVFYSE